MLMFFVVFTLIIAPSILYSFWVDDIRDITSKFSNRWRYSTSIVRILGEILLMLYIAQQQKTEFHSIGLNLERESILGGLVVAGLATAYLSIIFIKSNNASDERKNKINVQKRETLDKLGLSSVETFFEKVIALTILWLGVILEELVYRGFIILVMGSLTGTYLPWIVLSAVLSVLVHLYQGRTWRLIYAYVFLAVVFTVVTMVTKNIFAAIIPHIFYDTVWLLRGWKSLKERQDGQAQMSA